MITTLITTGAAESGGTASVEPLTLEQVKLNLKVDTDADDGLITDLIVDAREYVEREAELILVPRTLTETARELGPWIDLSSWPVTRVAEIRYPTAGVMATLPTGAWQVGLKRRPVRIIPVACHWGVPLARAPHLQALPVEIDVEAGYVDPTEIPRNATRAMHMLIGHWYSNRAGVEAGARAAAVEMPLGVTALLDRLRLQRI